MSQYFSRLAERSGVTASAQALPSRSARASETPGWGEQSSEVIVQPGPFVTGSSAENSNSIGQSASVYQENFPVDTATEILEMRRRKSASSAAVSETSNIASNAMAIDFHSTLLTTQSLPRASSMADEMPMASDPVASSSNTTNSNVDERNTIIAKPSRQSKKGNSTSAIHRQSESIGSDKTLVSAAPNTSFFDTTSIIKNRSINSGTSSAEWSESNKAIPSLPEGNKARSTARIASQPVQTVADSEIASRSSSRSSVQVSIGRIELEIHAPAKPAVRAPHVARTSAAPAKTPARHSAFNPHRHYLRSR